MSKNRKRRTQKPIEEQEGQWYVSAVTNAQLWFDKATELLMLGEILEQKIREAWADARKNAVSDVTLETEDLIKRIEEERRSDRWPLQAQSLYFMLVAFAIENLCKADIVRAQGLEISEEIKKSGKLSEELKTHDLVSLVRKVGLDLDQQEQVLLRHLQRTAVWSARYPVPAEAYRKILPNEYPAVIYMKAASPEEYMDHLKALVSKLCVRIRANAI